MAAREIVNVRVGAKGIEWMDLQARQYGLSRSDVIRACIAAGAGSGRGSVSAILKQMKDDKEVAV